MLNNNNQLKLYVIMYKISGWQETEANMATHKPDIQSIKNTIVYSYVIKIKNNIKYTLLLTNIL